MALAGLVCPFGNRAYAASTVGAEVVEIEDTARPHRHHHELFSVFFPI